MNEEKKGVSYPLGATLKRMLANVNRQNPALYGSCLLYTLAASLYPFLAVLLPRFMIGELEKGALARIENVLWIAGIYFMAAAFLGFLRTYIRDANYPVISRLRIDYVRDTSVKMMEMGYPHTEDAGFWQKYEKAITANSNNDYGMEGIYHKLFELPSVLITMAVLAVVIGLLNPLILLGLLLNLAATVWIGQKTHQFQYAHKEEEAKWSRRIEYYNRVTSDFTYGKDIRMFDLRQRILANYDAEIKGFVGVHRLFAKKEYLYSFAGLFTLLTADGLTYGILIWQTVNGMSIAYFSMYLTASILLSTYLKQAAEQFNFLLKWGQYVHEFYKFMDNDMGEKGGSHPAVTDDTLEIIFKDVNFRYPGTEHYIFRHLDFTIHKGERLAIVGVNGAGKSTLVKLMTGLFPVTEGQILINGIPLEEYDKKALYQMFSVVFQESNLMAFTVEENVACRAEGIDGLRVDTALEKVGMAEKIKQLPKGKKQMLLKVIEEDGALFSGGEKQKLTIARALYKDAPMVIMDEPTAALDALAEAEIYEDFSGLVKGKTAVYISHRLASTRFCDHIALFDQDGLQEYGTHEELMKKRGSYYEMFTVQGKYYTQKEGQQS